MGKVTKQNLDNIFKTVLKTVNLIKNIFTEAEPE